LSVGVVAGRFGAAAATVTIYLNAKKAASMFESGFFAPGDSVLCWLAICAACTVTPPATHGRPLAG
jgi:hypothetical protein